jgi:hypothetical protein
MNRSRLAARLVRLGPRRLFAAARLVFAASLAVLAGCEFEGGKNSAQIEMNTCSSSNPCESGSECEEGRCVADAAETPLTIALEVTPLRMSDNDPQPAPIIVDPAFVVSEPTERDFFLPKAAEVKGLVRNHGMPIEANLSFVPTKTIPGIAAHAVTATVTSSATTVVMPSDMPDPDYTVKLLGGVEYRVLVKPMDMTLPPYSWKFVAGDFGRVDVNFDMLEGLREETFSITGDAADRDLLVTAVDVHGEPISSTASVSKGKATLVFAADTQDIAYRIEIRAAQSFDQEPATVTDGSLCDTDTPAFPVFSIDASALTQDDTGRWKIALPKQPERIPFEGTVELCPEEQANAASVTNLPITLHSRSLLLDQDTSITASFNATTSANYDKAAKALRFCVQVMPGEYDVLATPPASMACALFAESRLIKPPDDQEEDKAVKGALLALPKAAYLAGTVQASGQTPLSDASIEATALGRAAAVELPPGDRSITRYNRSSETSTAADGRFKLPVDLGSYDVVIKPLAESGFPWQVRPEVKVGLGARNLPSIGTTIDMRSPLVVTGSLRYKNASEGAQATLGGAEVEAYALIDDGERGKRALPVGKAIADEDGHFRLLLPLSIDGTW